MGNADKSLEDFIQDRADYIRKYFASLGTPRIALFVMETQMNGEGEYNALIAVEGEQGYYKTDWYWGKDYKLAQEIADERNFRMGLTKREAALIQCSTMRSVKMPEADDEPGDGHTGPTIK